MGELHFASGKLVIICLNVAIPPIAITMTATAAVKGCHAAMLLVRIPCFARPKQAHPLCVTLNCQKKQ